MIIYCLWAIQITLKVYVAVVLCRRRLFYSGLLVWLIGGAALSIWRAWVLIQDGHKGYAAVWRDTQILDYLFSIIIVIDVLHRIGKHFPSAIFNTVVSSVFALVSLVSVFTAVGWAPELWPGVATGWRICCCMPDEGRGGCRWLDNCCFSFRCWRLCFNGPDYSG